MYVSYPEQLGQTMTATLSTAAGTQQATCIDPADKAALETAAYDPDTTDWVPSALQMKYGNRKASAVLTTMPECGTRMRVFSALVDDSDAEVQRLRTATREAEVPSTRTTATRTRIPRTGVEPAVSPRPVETEEKRRLKTLAVGGLVLILVAGGGYAVYRGVKRK